MKYFFYILKWDSGFAPNPFYEFCTLATCKPKIRKQAKVGDWVIGLGSKNQNNLNMNFQGRLIYAMQVTEKMTFDDYWRNKKFSEKKYKEKPEKRKYGDNIYCKNSKGHLIQKKSFFHKDEENIKKDIRGKNVLISDYFFYFGEKNIELPNSLKKSVIKTQGYKYKGLEIEGKKLIKLLEKKYKKNKLYGNPIGYKDIKNKCNFKKTRKKSSQVKFKGYRNSFKLCG